MLLQDEGPRADHALLEIAVFFQHLTREDDGHGLRHVLREHGIRRLEMHANGVPVGDRHALDFLERERLHPLLRIGLVAVLDVVGDKLPPVERRHVVPSHALAQPEGPRPGIRAPLPCLREVALEREVGVVPGFVGERIAEQAVVGERRDLEETHRVRQAWIEHGRIPRRGARHAAAALGRFIAGGKPRGIGRGRMGQGARATDPDEPGAGDTGPPGLFEKIPPSDGRPRSPVDAIIGSHSRSPSRW